MQSLSPRYTRTALLHEGTSTSLYHGARNADRAPVTIKLLKQAYPSPRELAQLRHEYLITRELDISSVVRAYELAQTEHGLALVLEDFGGQPLDALLLRGPLDLTSTLTIGAALAGAVGAIHDRQIVHKDIKPHNILVNPATGEVKLTDFGIATRLSQETQEDARLGALEGTLAYMSPEQTGRMNRQIDRRTDLYSLGVTLYEMLTGALPFPTTDAGELVHSHIARTPRSPRERSAAIPAVVSDIVMKLLSKEAEDRYQSSYGLKADLEECLSQWRGQGAIAPFPLAQRDVTGALRALQKLYGREAEVSALREAFARASAGGAELMLVMGYAGAGKSALVRELQPTVARRGGYFVSGKFDPITRSVPGAAMAAALRELVRYMLAEPEEALLQTRGRLLAAVGSSGQILLDIVPELAGVIGPQPQAPELGPAESQNRFGLLFQRFLRVFATAERPLVLFFDDLQWADPASLRLLTLALTDPDRGHLLVVGAYRDLEVGPGHLFLLTLEELRKSGVQVGSIAVGPLSPGDVEQIVADSLGESRAAVAQFAAIALEKAHGNPFFLSQLLQVLHADGHIAFDRAAGAWRFDLDRIRSAEAQDSVIDLMARRLASLAPRTQRALRRAACIGHRFDIKTLSVISGAPSEQVAADLWEALQAGLVLPLDADYRFLTDASGPEGAVPPPSAFDAAFRFLHDRVQQAAYAQIEEGQRAEAHLKIGRRMRAQLDDSARDERLFEILDHLNLGVALIQERDERLWLARSNLAAGRRAKAATAYAQAVSYLRAGAAVLDEESWEAEYPLAFALHGELAECAFLSGQSEAARGMFDVLLARARSGLDRARVHLLLLALHGARSELSAAIRAGRAGLRELGIDLPDSGAPAEAALRAEMAQADGLLAGRGLGDLLDAPSADGPELLTCMEMLVKLGPSLLSVDASLWALVAVKRFNLCLTCGHSKWSSYCFVIYSLLLAARRGRPAEAGELFRVARALDERFGDLTSRCQTYFVFATIAFFFEPLRAAAGYAAEAHRAGLETGELEFASYAACHAILSRLGAGDALDVLRGELESGLAFVRRTGTAMPRTRLVIVEQMIKCLTGRTRDRLSLSDEALEEDALVAQLEAEGIHGNIGHYAVTKLQLALLYGDGERAREALALAERHAPAAVGFYYPTELPFHAGLLLAAQRRRAASADGDAAAEMERLAVYQERLATLAEHCPANYRHMHLLLSAEAARIAERYGDARELYDEAIAAAEASGFTHHVALCSERAALFYLDRGQVRNARVYMSEAYQAYLRWGATAKVEDLAERYHDLLDRPASAPRGSTLDQAASAVTTTTGGSLGAPLDAAAIVRAAQAIAGEIALDRLLDRLMRIVTENAGADRGLLLLPRGGALVVEASMTVNPERVRVGLSTPLDAFADIATSVVQLVQRTGEPVVLGDAAAEGPFAADPYLQARPPRSLLCLAMTHQGRLAGVLYLENRAAREAFTRARVELSAMLAAQAAIAVENARMMADIKRRTEALGEANAALSAANERLSRELREREQAEAARAALQQELVRVQTPLIPITDRIVVMPLIGTIDAERAHHVLETALRGVHQGRARILIVDITGMETVDGEAMRTLLRTASALRLLGSEAVITGIRPDVARRLVDEQRLSTGSLVTRGTLQDGISYAMGRLQYDAKSRPSLTDRAM